MLQPPCTEGLSVSSNCAERFFIAHYFFSMPDAYVSPGSSNKGKGTSHGGESSIRSPPFDSLRSENFNQQGAVET